MRSGYLPEREILTGIGAVPVKVPRLRDHEAAGSSPLTFTAKIVSRFLRKARSVEELIPWLYQRGVSREGFGDPLEALLGPGVNRHLPLRFLAP